MKIIVLNAFGLHLGYLGCYGNDWVATPNLDRLATEGAVFDFHFADQPTFVPVDSASAWTGQYPFVVNESSPPSTNSLVGMLRGAGLPCVRAAVNQLDNFASEAFSIVKNFGASPGGLLWLDGPNLAPPWHLDDDMLDSYFEEDDPQGGWPDPPTGEVERLADVDLERLQNTYAAVVTFYDAQIGALRKKLEHAGALEEVLWCVTAGSGLALGEHYHVGEAVGLHEEICHIPLIMRFPLGRHAGARVFALTQPVDLFPTIVALASLPTITSAGSDLMPLIEGNESSIRDHAFTIVPNSGSWAVRELDWALLVEGGSISPKLYVKPDDRWEVNDVRQANLDKADELEKMRPRSLTP